ncbi:MAG: hypothetical protein AAFX40_16485 [Cyanobacteria bacterium J06639_1]
MSELMQYVTNDRGERVGVLLGWQAYSRLATSSSELDGECLVGLSIEDLEALAGCKLAVAEQARVDELVADHAESLLDEDELVELDELLAKADRLTVLKTRARYTLKCLGQGTTAA